jgi:hypothetical protein
VVDTTTNTETVLAERPALYAWDAFITRDGNYIFTSGGSQGTGGATLHNTRFDLDTGAERDTLSSHLPTKVVSNVTTDSRHYFTIASHDDLDAIYHVELEPPEPSSEAPNITDIAFSAPALLDEEGATIGIAATIADTGGAETVKEVWLIPLVEGREEPDWDMGREPLEYPGGYPGGDFGYEQLFDDGTHGDVVAGDGVFTFNTITTRKGGREGEGAFNTWFAHYTLPAEVGIRILAEDEDGNFSIADTTLLITDDPLDAS